MNLFGLPLVSGQNSLSSEEGLSHLDTLRQEPFNGRPTVEYQLAIQTFLDRGREWGFIEDLHHRQMRCHLRQLPHQELMDKYKTAQINTIITDHLPETRAYELSQQIERVAACISDVYYPGQTRLKPPGNVNRLEMVNDNAFKMVNRFFSLPLDQMAKLYSQDRFFTDQRIWNDWKITSIFRKKLNQYIKEKNGWLFFNTRVTASNDEIMAGVTPHLLRGIEHAAQADHRKLALKLLTVYLSIVDPAQELSDLNPLPNGSSLLEVAVDTANEELVQALLRAHARVTQEIWDKGSHIQKIRLPLLHSLIQANHGGVQFDHSPVEDWSEQLFDAIKEGDWLKVTDLHQKIDVSLVHLRNEEGKVPLELFIERLATCYVDPPQSAIFLYSSYPPYMTNVNIRNEEGRTPLHRVKELRSRCEAPSPIQKVVAMALAWWIGFSFATGSVIVSFGASCIPLTIIGSFSSGIPIAALPGLPVGAGCLALGILLLLSCWKARKQSKQNELSQMKRDYLDFIIQKLQRADALDLPDNEGIRPSDL